jgi:hypothetical protein
MKRDSVLFAVGLAVLIVLLLGLVAHRATRGRGGPIGR